MLLVRLVIEQVQSSKVRKATNLARGTCFDCIVMLYITMYNKRHKYIIKHSRSQTEFTGPSLESTNLEFREFREKTRIVHPRLTSQALLAGLESVVNNRRNYTVK